MPELGNFAALRRIMRHSATMGKNARRRDRAVATSRLFLRYARVCGLRSVVSLPKMSLPYARLHRDLEHEDIVMATPTRLEMTELFASAVEHCRFGLIAGGRVASFVDATTLRARYEAGFRPVHVINEIEYTHPAMVQLLDAMRDLLANYLDDNGHIGLGLISPGQGYSSTPLDSFAKHLLRSGATLGPEWVVDKLYRWIDGEVFSYWRLFLLNAHPAKPKPAILPVQDGLKLSVMPGSTDELHRMFPAMATIFFMSYKFYLGKILLSVEYQSSIPGIYKPEPDSAPWPEEHQVAIRDFDVDRFCEALSLAHDQCVRWTACWWDYGDDLREICQPTNMSHCGTPARSGAYIELSADKLSEAATIYKQRESAGTHRLDTAIHRWCEARDDSVPHSDRLIDLRIALEALYAGGEELRFRQSIHGALHLGTDFEQRKRYRKLLHKVYGDASKVVHASRNSEPSAADVETFKESRDLCRQGILKCLAEGGKIDFDRLVLA